MSRAIGGLSNIKTSQKAKIHAKPRLEGAEYLDIYLMIKERQRLEHYKSVIGKSNARTEEDLVFINKEIEKLERGILSGARGTEPRKTTEKRSTNPKPTIMTIGY